MIIVRVRIVTMNRMASPFWIAVMFAVTGAPHNHVKRPVTNATNVLGIIQHVQIVLGFQMDQPRKINLESVTERLFVSTVTKLVLLYG